MLRNLPGRNLEPAPDSDPSPRNGRGRDSSAHGESPTSEGPVRGCDSPLDSSAQFRRIVEVRAYRRALERADLTEPEAIALHLISLKDRYKLGYVGIGNLLVQGKLMPPASPEELKKQVGELVVSARKKVLRAQLTAEDFSPGESN